MVFAPRRIVYPFFIAVFAIIFFGLLYLAFLNQSLKVDDPTFSVAGDQLVVKMSISNTSQHVVDGVKVIIRSQDTEQAFYLHGTTDPKDSSLAPGEKYDFAGTVPLANSLSYTITVLASFNRPVNLRADLSQSVVNPVAADVSIPSNLALNKEYNYLVKLCNISDTDLQQVVWSESADTGLFKEDFFDRTVSLQRDECKSLLYTITPIRTGELKLWFTLRVGTLERKEYKVFNVTGN